MQLIRYFILTIEHTYQLMLLFPFQRLRLACNVAYTVVHNHYSLLCKCMAGKTRSESAIIFHWVMHSHNFVEFVRPPLQDKQLPLNRQHKVVTSCK